jgi:hypothetical protein
MMKLSSLWGRVMNEAIARHQEAGLQVVFAATSSPLRKSPLTSVGTEAVP